MKSYLILKTLEEAIEIISFSCPLVKAYAGNCCLYRWIRLVTDIPATTGTDFGQEIMFYESPRPLTGIHRFVFILYRQLGRQTVFAPAYRHNFSCRNFSQDYNLGSPVAAVYFNCQREGGTGGRRHYRN
ncbi:protein RICE FLOWERINGUS T 1-like [Euphorbia lathyris]|uniref:protein RICE FLOWERINGUS T 1-like n=1 Tax=Euphorbia lathyris TaxID=212925 RepID=UPI0033144C40